ncbi:MAG TPA: glycosyltransferase [Candidatus Limnocylindrales bacterium]|nr:glycosyltransferase [Candidatus Limnocylindrales bacterium]
MILLAIIFVVASFLLGWVYVGYPFVVAIAARGRPMRLRAGDQPTTLSVLIAVHNEAAAIADRIADVLAQDGPDCPIVDVVVGSDGSTDETEAIVTAIAAGEPRVHLLALPRAGQTPTQAALIAAATGDVFVLTDAETRYAPGALARLRAPFTDPRVGAATGRLEWRDEGATATSRNEGLYWRYERRVRDLESRVGWLTAVTGAFLAVRRTSYRPVPATASMDHLLPLYVREQGGIVVYVPEAIATDRPISGLREQFRSRTRTATRGIRANLSMVGRLAPWRHPAAALAIWSHKLLRWGTPLLGITAVVSATGLALGGLLVAWVVPVIALAGALAAGIAHLLVRAGRTPPRAFAFARAFGVVNAAFLLAWVNVLRRRRIETWRRMEWEATGR